MVCTSASQAGAQVNSITRQDVLDFLKAWERPDGAVLGVVGASLAFCYSSTRHVLGAEGLQICHLQRCCGLSCRPVVSSLKARWVLRPEAALVTQNPIGNCKPSDMVRCMQATSTQPRCSARWRPSLGAGKWMQAGPRNPSELPPAPSPIPQCGPQAATSCS